MSSASSGSRPSSRRGRAGADLTTTRHHGIRQRQPVILMSEWEAEAMTVRVGINGFGRIGRQSLRAILERYPDRLQVAAINDIADLATNAHLFRHDSNYGAFSGRVESRDGELQINDWTVKVFSGREPAAVPWKDAGVELVVEST